MGGGLREPLALGLNRWPALWPLKIINGGHNLKLLGISVDGKVSSKTEPAF